MPGRRRRIRLRLAIEREEMTYLAAAIQMAAGPDKAANLERAERLIRLAAARGANLVAGSITELAQGHPQNYNTSTMFGPDGSLLAVYRKIHLFDVDLPGRVTIRESDAKLPGAEVVTVS